MDACTTQWTRSRLPQRQAISVPCWPVARAIFLPHAYDCLGCATCYPAIATNAMADAYPEFAEGLPFCPTEEARPRAGWPPLPGDYRTKTLRASVAVCTLNSPELMDALVENAPVGLAIAGTMRTENLGIERLCDSA